MKYKKECGECTTCCELLPIPELQKPESTLCGFCKINVGCSIYKSRPNSCKEFNCVYIQNEEIDLELRPDNCKVMFERVTDTLYLALELPRDVGSWREKKVSDFIKKLNENGISIIVSSFTKTPKEFLLAEGVTKEQAWNMAINELNKI